MSDTAGLMSELLDKAMLHILQEGGVPMKAPDGSVLLDADGQPMLGPIPAAMMGQIIKRIDQIRRTGTGGMGPDSAAARLQNAVGRGLADGTIKFNGKPIPDLNIDDRDAASA